MNDFTLLTDDELMHRIIAGHVKAFEILFHRYYEKLCRYAFKFVSQSQVAEEIVSGMFTQVWEKRNQLLITTSAKAYLYASVKNASLNYLKSQYNRQSFQSETKAHQHPAASSPADDVSFQELQAIIQQGIDTLPERCRIIFTLSRQAGLSYEEIATELGISKKTVKAQMGIALQKLRLYVDCHWDKMLIMLLQIF